jgi:hypothetical protein
MEICGGGVGELIGREETPIGVVTIERVGRIQREKGAISEVAGHPCGRLAAVVGRDSGNNHAADPGRLEPAVEVRLTVEGRVDVLDDQQVGIAVDDVLELVAHGARTQRGSRLEGVVAHEDDRPAARTPVPKKPDDVLLAGRVVALTPTRILKRTLHVDQQQCSSVKLLAFAHEHIVPARTRDRLPPVVPGRRTLTLLEGFSATTSRNGPYRRWTLASYDHDDTTEARAGISSARRVGVAGFGTLYLTLAGHHSPGRAFGITALAFGATALLAMIPTHLATRRRSPTGTEPAPVSDRAVRASTDHMHGGRTTSREALGKQPQRRAESDGGDRRPQRDSRQSAARLRPSSGTLELCGDILIGH